MIDLTIHRAYEASVDFEQAAPTVEYLKLCVLSNPRAKGEAPVDIGNRCETEIAVYVNSREFALNLAEQFAKAAKQLTDHYKY